jgi:hypothetical protein
LITREYTLAAEGEDVVWRQILQFLHRRGADRFTFNILHCGDRRAESDRIYDRFASFSTPPPILENVQVRREDEFFRFDGETVDVILREVDGNLLKEHARFADAWAENWRIYRNGELILGTITHEGIAFLRLNIEDVAEARHWGILAWFKTDGA